MHGNDHVWFKKNVILLRILLGAYKFSENITMTVISINHLGSGSLKISTSGIKSTIYKHVGVIWISI